MIHHGVEERFARREVDVDRCADDTRTAGDLGHAGVGIAREGFEGSRENDLDFVTESSTLAIKPSATAIPTSADGNDYVTENMHSRESGA